MQVVSRGDRPAYLSGLLLPERARRGFFAVRALNVEVARIPEVVQGNEMTAALRYQWWRDVIDYAWGGAGAQGVAQHPVARELRGVLQEHKLTRRWLDRMIDAREADMLDPQPSTMAEVEAYAERTAGAQTLLLLELLGVRDATADHAAVHVGRAVGISTLLSGVVHLHLSGYARLPRDVMLKHQLRKRAFTQAVDHALELQGLPVKAMRAEEDEQARAQALREGAAAAGGGHGPPIGAGAGMARGPLASVGGEKVSALDGGTKALTAEELATAHSRLVDCVFEVASVAHGHLEHARALRDKMPSQALPAFLPATWAALYLERLEQKAAFDVLSPKARMSKDPFAQLGLMLRLARNRLNNSF
jgi:phytoene/squalene synthetase